MAVEESIISLMRMKGPVLPADVAKTIKTNLIIASAHLSEMSDRRKIKISHLKVGGSPLYYLPGHEEKLQEYAGNLDEKDYRVFEALKESKVLRDSVLDPLSRVALREIRDFAVPLNVSYGGKQEVFWKWFLISDAEASGLIKSELGVVEALKGEAFGVPGGERKEVVKEVKREVVVPQQTVTEEKPEIKRVVKEIKKEEQIKLTTEKKEVKRERKPKVERKRKEIISAVEDNFSGLIENFFKEKEVKVIEEEVVRKNAEINYIIEVPSAIGSIKYFCKVKNKKSCTDKDLSSVLVEGQLKKMPVVFVYTGSLNAKAQEMAKTDMFKNVVLHKLGNGD